MKKRSLVLIFILVVAPLGSSTWKLMDDARRRQNQRALQGCSPAFRSKAVSLLLDLEVHHYRPKIRETWRSPDAQQQAYFAGRSEVRSGAHNYVDSHGKPAAEALDLEPQHLFGRSDTEFAMAVACYARREGLHTGATWGLDVQARAELEKDIKNCSLRNERLGWDPLHIECEGHCQ